MNVRTRWLVIPIVLVLGLITAAAISFQYVHIESSTAGYDYKTKLFDEEAIGTIDITISDENWQKILDDPTAEQYVEANVSVNGETYENVGVRAKGNSSLSSVANSESERYSLKVDFAQYDSTQTYYGLDTLNLNNNFSDTTQMKEFVSYELMEQLGVTTPAHSYVKVNVNGTYYGLMLAVEEVGESFAKTNFGSTEGFIYKPEGDGSDLAYVSDDVDDYSGIFGEAKMNAQTAENNSTVISMMKEISEGNTSSLDLEQITKYFALNTALVNMDSYQGSFKHNYYLYENEEGKFSIIPWDYNMAFGGFNMGGGDRNEDVERSEAGANQSTSNDMNEQQIAPEANTRQGVPNVNGEQQQDLPQQGNPPPRGNMGNGDMPPMNGESTTNSNLQGQPPTNNGQMPPVNNEQIMREEEGDEPSKNNPNGGDSLMLNETIVTDDSVNFTISEPVSGTTIDERPLLKVILENEEARNLYDYYLEQIATDILTEENVASITTKLEALLLQAVEEDPSKFSTTEQFIAGVSGEQSLPEFAKQRSESILKQLSGEIEGVVGASSGFGGMGGQGDMPNGDMPDFDGDIPNMPNGDMPNFSGNMPPMNDTANASTMNGRNLVILLASSISVIAIAIYIVLRRSRKKFKRGSVR